MNNTFFNFKKSTIFFAISTLFISSISACGDDDSEDDDDTENDTTNKPTGGDY